MLQWKFQMLFFIGQKHLLSTPPGVLGVKTSRVPLVLVLSKFKTTNRPEDLVVLAIQVKIVIAVNSDLECL